MAKPTEKTSVAVNTPARVEIDVNKAKPARKRTGTSPSKASRPRRDETSEYRRRYKPPPMPQYPRSPRGYEPKYIPEQVKDFQIQILPSIYHSFVRNHRNRRNVRIRTTKASVEMWNWELNFERNIHMED